LRQKLQEIEPFVPVYRWGTAVSLWLCGKEGEALAILENLPSANLGREFYLSRIYAKTGYHTRVELAVALATDAGHRAQ